MSLPLPCSLLLVSLFIMTSSSCSHRTTEGQYLDATSDPCHQSPLKPLQQPSGFSLPAEDETYKMPPAPKLIKTDPLDIRPPIQPLALLPGSETFYQKQQLIIQLAPESDGKALWEQLQQQLIQQGITLTTPSIRAKKVLTTDWMVIQEGKEGIEGRWKLSYLASLDHRSSRLIAELLASRPLEQSTDHHTQQGMKSSTNNLTTENKKITDYQQRHYTILWLNQLLTEWVAKNTQIADSIDPKLPFTPGKSASHNINR